MSACPPSESGYPVLGMQSGEEVATTLRLVALCISISVLFPWLDTKRRGHMRIFFLHWVSGVLYVMSQFIMSVMVLNCWNSRDRAGPVIFVLKFGELVVLNLWSISSLAIALLIAVIVQSFSKFRRVPAMIGSPRAALYCIGAAIIATVLSAAFWNGLLVTGAYFWVTNTNIENHARWITLSFGATQTVAGMLMAVVVIYTVTGARRPSLIVCCKTNQRVYYHFILTIFGTFVYVYNGVVLMVDEFSDFKVSKRLVIIGWCSRYVHVIADTAIIFGAFKALERDRSEVQGLSSTGSGSGTTNGGAGTGVSSFPPLPRPPTMSILEREGGSSRTAGRTRTAGASVTSTPASSSHTDGTHADDSVNKPSASWRQLQPKSTSKRAPTGSGSKKHGREQRRPKAKLAPVPKE